MRFRNRYWYRQQIQYCVLGIIAALTGAIIFGIRLYDIRQLIIVNGRGNYQLSIQDIIVFTAAALLIVVGMVTIIKVLINLENAYNRNRRFH